MVNAPVLPADTGHTGVKDPHPRLHKPRRGRGLTVDFDFGTTVQCAAIRSFVVGYWLACTFTGDRHEAAARYAIMDQVLHHRMRASIRQLLIVAALPTLSV